LDKRVKKEEQDEHAVLVHVQLAVAGPIPLATDFMQPLQQRKQLLELLHSLHVPLFDLFLAVGHPP